MVGTPKYIPPEYLETGESDHRGDIYALGVLGYEMLSGVSPFPADSRELLTARRGAMKVPSLIKVAPHCPPALAAIVERAMNPNLAQRYQSAEELRHDLERFESGGVASRGATRQIEPSLVPHRPRPETAGHRSSFSFSRVVAAGGVVGLFSALIVVIARPVFFGALPPPRQAVQFDFRITPTEAAATTSVDPGEIGRELLRIGELETQYRELHNSLPYAVRVGREGAIPGGPTITEDPGTISLVKVRQRRLWLEREVARLGGKST